MRHRGRHGERPRTRTALLLAPPTTGSLVALSLAFAVVPLAPPSRLAAVQRGDTGLAGTVVLGLTDEPVHGAEVILIGSGRRVTTGAGGRFLLEDLAPGQETVVVHYLGLSSMRVPVHLQVGSVTSIELAIVGPMFQMDELLVEVRGLSALKLAGFEKRRRQGTGYYLDRGEIRERRALQTSDLLDGVRGARVIVDVNGRRIIRVRAPRGYCSPELYIDGHLLNGVWIDDLLPEHLEALEFYPRWWDRPTAYRTALRYDSLPGIGAPAPISQDECGAVLLWTREGGA